MPTNVLSKYTWGRNGSPTAFLSVLPLYLGLGFVFSELGALEALRVPVALAGVDSGVVGISGNPLLLLSALFGFRLGGLGSVAHVRPQYDV